MKCDIKNNDNLVITVALYLIKDLNDLATLRPELLEDWDYAKNADVLPSMITTASS